jgi:hypothetical protein
MDPFNRRAVQSGMEFDISHDEILMDRGQR